MVCVHLAKAWQRRRYQGAFVATLNKAAAAAAGTQTWLEFSILCGYLAAETGQELFHHYGTVLTAISRLIDYADAWVIKP